MSMANVSINQRDTALLFTDPQVDALKPEGVMWEQVGETVEKNNVVEKLQTLREAANDGGIQVVYSPHYYTDDEFKSWQHLNGIDQMMFDARMYDVEREGSEIIQELEPDENTFVLSPHKQLSGFWTNDVTTQLRQRGIDTIVFGGMFANLCVESHLRDAVENGFKTLAVTDATGAPGMDALDAARTNYELIAHETATTDEVVDRLRSATTESTAAEE